MENKELDEKHRELLNKMRQEEESLRMLQDEKRRLQTRVRSSPEDRTLEEINEEILEHEEQFKKLEEEYINTPIVYSVRKLKPIIIYEDQYGNVIKEPSDKQGTFKFYYYPRGQLTAERAAVDVQDGVPKRIRFLEWHSDYMTNLPVTIEIPLEVEHVQFIKVVEVPKYIEIPVGKQEDSKDVTPGTNVPQSRVGETNSRQTTVDSDVTQCKIAQNKADSRRFSRFKAESKEIFNKILRRDEKYESEKG